MDARCVPAIKAARDGVQAGLDEELREPQAFGASRSIRGVGPVQVAAVAGLSPVDFRRPGLCARLRQRGIG